jgi:hypothetical protein
MARTHIVAVMVMMAGSAAMAQQGGQEPKPAQRATPAQPATTARPATPAQPATPAKPSQPGQPAAQPGHDFQLPPGMTQEDMEACMAAGTPGPNHEFLAKAIGTWDGKMRMWMTPEAPVIESTCTTVISSAMDGRFTKCETTGEMPGMPGPFNGFGLYGYDNVGKTFQSVWIDNCGTGMMRGKGELSSDGKTLTWTYDYNCPIAKGPVKMREIERWTGPNSMVLEMYGPDKTGKEFKMMEITSTRKAGASPAAGARATGMGAGH